MAHTADTVCGAPALGSAAGVPEISAVIASQGALAVLETCLQAVLAQGAGDSLEVVVVDSSRDGRGAIIVRRFPGVLLVPGPPTALVPELWAIGIERSRGRIVALTSAQCVPGAGWLEAIRRAHLDPAAVGGAVEPDPAGNLRTWAVYFCRYSGYMLPRPEEPATDLAADNASYRWEDLGACRDVWKAGFWEPAVHAALRGRGVPLRFVPDIVVHHRGGVGVHAFVRQRMRHGRAFGEWRAATLSVPGRVFHALAAPVIPGLLLARIARRVWVTRRHRARFLAALPLLGLFLGAWSLGELVGTLRARAPVRAPLPPVGGEGGGGVAGGVD